MSLETCLKQGYLIRSVIRIEDGAVFQIGLYAKYTSNTIVYKIEEFKLGEFDRPYVKFEGDNKWYDDFIGEYCHPATLNLKLEESYSRDDIIHAFTYGLDLGKKGISHAEALEQFKESQNI